ncbi:MAG: hypothetical protein AAF355_01020 [Myxococcota bacterium]
MGLSDRFSGQGPIAPPEITCPRYEPKPGTKRCQHYLKGGACALPDEFMCVEWLKANGHAVPEPLPPVEVEPPPPTQPPSSAPKVDRDLFGQPVERAPTSRPQYDDAPEPRCPPEQEVPVVRNLTDEDVASFKALGVEVCLATEDCGEVWLVPEYTGRDDRKEISVRDAATLAAVCSAFPGARVTSYERPAADDAS